MPAMIAMKPAMNETSKRPDWLQQVTFRLKTYWFVKMTGTMAAIAAFMTVYFLLMWYPQFPVTEVPWTPLDRFIAFRPWSVVPYVSLWPYISLVAALFVQRRELVSYLSAISLLSVAGFVIFFFWPTACVQPDLDWSRYPLVDFLKSAAPTANACPSMHVAFSVLTVLWLHRQLKQIGAPAALHWINVSWCLLILWSTLALKQHLALDLLAGVALGLVISVPHLYFLPSPEPDDPLPTTH